MKRIAFALILAASAACALVASEPDHGGLGLGFSVGDRGDDFSLGIEVTSPRFVSGLLALRAGGELLYKEGILTAGTEEIWQPYYLGRLGLLLMGRTAPPFRLYGEFGGACLFPTDRLCADPKPIPAIYGHFGFELPVADDSGGCYFIELGSTGVFGEGADLMTGAPKLAGGFAARAGFRWTF